MPPNPATPGPLPAQIHNAIATLVVGVYGPLLDQQQKLIDLLQQQLAAALIEVRKGANPDIRVAVVRKIIEIIRAHEPGDFVWVSRRLGRQIALSARPGDNAGLEEFMMREFFGDGRSP